MESFNKQFKTHIKVKQEYPIGEIKEEELEVMDVMKTEGDEESRKGTRPYKCNICNKTFAQKRYVKDHLRVHAEPYKCSVCNKSLAQKRYLKEHLLFHSGEKSYKCNICGTGFMLKGHLENHMGVHMGEKPYKCNICHKSFAQKIGLNYHLLFHTGERPHKCNVCNKTFIQKGTLKIHSLVHTGQKPGNKTFSDNLVIKKHRPNNIRIKPYKCNVCDKTFVKTHWKEHLLVHTEGKPYKCKVCNKTFTQTYSLKRHLLNHKPHKCNVCNKIFTKKSSFEDHLLIHTKEKPYKCNVCYKLFSHEHYLRSHLVVHTREKPYKCTVCNKAYRYKHVLGNHLRIHVTRVTLIPRFNNEKTEANPYKYDTVPKSLVKPKVTYGLVDTGERPYKCRFCSEAFRYRVTLQKHLQSHIKEEALDCKKFDGTFIQYTSSKNIKNDMGKGRDECLYYNAQDDSQSTQKTIRELNEEFKEVAETKNNEMNHFGELNSLKDHLRTYPTYTVKEEIKEEETELTDLVKEEVDVKCEVDIDISKDEESGVGIEKSEECKVVHAIKKLKKEIV